MIMEDTFRWAFIGTGNLATRVARLITSSGRHRIVSVFTRDPAKCNMFAKEYDAYAADNAKDAIDRMDVDAVYVATPHTSHYEYAKLAIELGKPVLCEKPVCTDAGMVEDLIQLSHEKNIYFTEAMWTWFSPVSWQVKHWLDTGEFGEVKKVHVTYCMHSIASSPRLIDPNLAGGALLDIGIYPLTYIYRLFGMPDKIECKGRVKKGIDTGEKIRLYYPGNKVYTVSVSIVNPLGRENLWLYGTEGKLHLRGYYRASEAKLIRRHGMSQTFHGDGNILHEFDVVAREIRQGLSESEYVPHQATLDVMKLMDECRKQMNLVYPFETKA